MANTFIKIETQTVGSGGVASVTFSSIPATYTDLKLVLSTRDARALTVSDIFVTFNGSGGTYSGRYVYGNGTSAVSTTTTDGMAWGTGASNTASVFGNSEVYIPNYTSANAKSYSSDSTSETNATDGYVLLLAGLWTGTDAITSILLTPFTANFAQYSTFSLYGIKKN